MRTVLSLLILAVALSTTGCLERTTTADSAHSGDSGWRLGARFGGEAELSVSGDDPLELRYVPGGFKQISGLDVTENEVWVCDLDISRIQVFNYDGRLLRMIGSGVDAEAALPSDFEHYDESIGFNRREDTRWEDLHGGPWIGSYRTHFRAADIAVMPDGYWLADQTRTSGLRDPYRPPGVFFVPDEGDVRILEFDQLVWPSHLAARDDSLAVSDYRANHLVFVNFTTEPDDINPIQRGGSFTNMMAVEVQFADKPQYLPQHARFTSASTAVGGTFLPGGMAFAFGKLAVCDTLNHRVQVFEARTDNANWGQVIREIRSNDRNGMARFEVPLDIEISAAGMVYVCDGGAAEIVELDPGFERVGAFGGDELGEPYALALSPDGRHCFVTDRRSNMVLRFDREE